MGTIVLVIIQVSMAIINIALKCSQRSFGPSQTRLRDGAPTRQ